MTTAHITVHVQPSADDISVNVYPVGTGRLQARLSFGGVHVLAADGGSCISPEQLADLLIELAGELRGRAAVVRAEIAGQQTLKLAAPSSPDVELRSAGTLASHTASRPETEAVA